MISIRFLNTIPTLPSFLTTESLYNIVMSIRGKIHNVVVRLQTVETLNRNSGYSSSSGSSAEEEDVKSNGGYKSNGYTLLRRSREGE